MCIFINLKRLEKKRLNVSCVTAEHEIVTETMTCLLVIPCRQESWRPTPSFSKTTKWSISITASSSSTMIGKFVMIWTMAYDHCRDRRLRICLPLFLLRRRLFNFLLWMDEWTTTNARTKYIPTLNDRDGWGENRRHGENYRRLVSEGKRGLTFRGLIDMIITKMISDRTVSVKAKLIVRSVQARLTVHLIVLVLIEKR